MTRPNRISQNAVNSQQRSMAISRRQFLRGVGVSIALPTFPSLMSRRGIADELPKAVTGLATTATGAPLRMAFMSIPNGVQQDHWFPSDDFTLNDSMAPLEGLKQHFQVIGGLDHQHATAGRDGAGDHARASATFLTGARARKTAGSDIHVGVSVDQVAAQKFGHLTRFPSLELSSDVVRNSGSCDSGYACAYQYNLAWSSPTTPVSPEPNPRLVFERLFGAGDKADRQKNFAIRQEMELRLKAAERFKDRPEPDVQTPAGIPSDFAEYMQFMYDMLILAFQTDSTRIGTLLLAYDGSNKTYPQIGIPEGHHYLTHNQRNPQLVKKVAEIDKYHLSCFAKFLEKMSKIEDIDGNSLLHNSMIVYGGAIADGNRHTHDNLPVILAGHAGGAFPTNRFFKAPKQPMSNLFVTMLNQFGVETDKFGDSNGRLTF